MAIITREQYLQVLLAKAGGICGGLKVENMWTTRCFAPLSITWVWVMNGLMIPSLQIWSLPGHL